MRRDDHLSFMPPDEPTAVYPIGASSEDRERADDAQAVADLGAAPQPPAPTAPDAPSTGINPMIALALVGVPLVIALGVVALTAFVLYLP